MTQHITPPQHSADDCQRVELELPDYLEGTLAPAQRDAIDAHRRHCAACETLLHDLESLVVNARALPPLAPSHDLWSGIAARLDTNVTPLPLRTTATTNAPTAPRTVSVRTLAIAAALLVAVTSGVTWRVARVQRTPGLRTNTLAAITPPAIPSENAIRAEDTVSAPPVVDAPVPTRLVASSPADVDDIYEREISALRTVVNERFTELDSATVVALRRNLAIIDAAIADSRRALQRDPRSRLLGAQLDRAIETKLALMRRVALL
jgi:hypothetical protein